MSDPHNSSSNTPELLYDRGIECLQSQSWQAAVAIFTELVLAAPEFEEAWDRLKQAQDKIRKLEDLEFLFRVSKTCLENEQWETAGHYLRQIVDSGENYGNAADLLEEVDKQLGLKTLRNRAEAQIRGQNWEKAIEVLEDIIRIDPTDKDADVQLDQARRQYRLESVYQRVLVHFRGEKWPQAILDLKTILGKDPNYRDAADRLKEAQNQQELAALYSSGVGLQETGRSEEAIDKYREIIRRVRGYKDVAERLADTQREDKLNRLISQGTEHLQRGEWEEAVRTLGEVHMLDPSCQGVRPRLIEAKRQLRLEELNKRGEACFRAENWQEAVEIFEELRELVPRDGSVVTRLDEAQRQLDLGKLYLVGMGHFRLNRWRKAKSALEKVLLLDPGYRDAAANLETVRERLARSNPIIEILRDPLWQGIGGVGAIVALVLTVYPFVKGKLPNLTVPPRPTPKPAGLCTGGFERNFECWQRGGELDQSVECGGEECLAVLGNPGYKCEGGVPVGEAWIKQSFKVPETVSPTLSLRYRVFSYDLDNLDFFEVSISDRIFGRYGNTEWNESSCDREVWDSGWQPVEFDLSPFSGERVEISLRNINGTYEWWNTWTYVDVVEIR